MNKSAQESLKTSISFPDKLFYKIGEVSRIVDVEPYVLRYWETEFPFLKPRKNKSGQRVYIKRMLNCLSQSRDFCIRKDIRLKVSGNDLDFLPPEASLRLKGIFKEKKSANLPGQLSMSKRDSEKS